MKILLAILILIPDYKWRKWIADRKRDRR